MPRSTMIVLAAAALLIAVASFFGFRHFSQLNQQLGDLAKQVEDLNGRASAAEERASAAESQAVEAAAKANEARSAADEAAQRASEAMAREEQSAQQAAEAEIARQQAEELERVAQVARQEADRKTGEADQARKIAEQGLLAAEERSIEAMKNAVVAESEARRAREETEQVRRQLEKKLGGMHDALGKIAETKRTALGLVMTLDSNQIEFDFNKATLRPENRELISRIAGVLLTFDNYGIQIFGHTDDVGTEEYNNELSLKWAETVRQYLAEAGIDPAVMAPKGLGKGSPLVEGTDPQSRQRNRRVELAIVSSDGEYEGVIEQQPDPAAKVPGG